MNVNNDESKEVETIINTECSKNDSKDTKNDHIEIKSTILGLEKNKVFEK